MGEEQRKYAERGATLLRGGDPVHCSCGHVTTVAMIALHLFEAHGIEPQDLIDAAVIDRTIRTYHWVGDELGGDWNDPQNWAWSRDGEPGAGVPGGRDRAVFSGALAKHRSSWWRRLLRCERPRPAIHTITWQNT